MKENELEEMIREKNLTVRRMIPDVSNWNTCNVTSLSDISRNIPNITTPLNIYIYNSVTSLCRASYNTLVAFLINEFTSDDKKNI